MDDERDDRRDRGPDDPPDDLEPELAWYEPTGPDGATDDDAYSDRRRRRRRLLLQVTVIVAAVALVLPGILIAWLTADRTAQFSCLTYAARYAPDAISAQARFELFTSAPGWNCYATYFGGEERALASLGLIPGAPVPLAPAERT